jgi:large subunit ribosomal protein L20
MSRAKSGIVSKKRHKKLLSQAKGFRDRHRKCFKIAMQKVERSLQYAYRDRRNKKRDFRRLWIQRINAEARKHNIVYSQLMNGISKAGISINRKMLAEMAVNDSNGFASVVEKAKKALAA